VRVTDALGELIVLDARKSIASTSSISAKSQPADTKKEPLKSSLMRLLMTVVLLFLSVQYDPHHGHPLPSGASVSVDEASWARYPLF